MKKLIFLQELNALNFPKGDSTTVEVDFVPRQGEIIIMGEAEKQYSVQAVVYTMAKADAAKRPELHATVYYKAR